MLQGQQDTQHRQYTATALHAETAILCSQLRSTLLLTVLLTTYCHTSHIHGMLYRMMV